MIEVFTRAASQRHKGCHARVEVDADIVVGLMSSQGLSLLLVL